MEKKEAFLYDLLAWNTIMYLSILFDIVIDYSLS